MDQLGLEASEVKFNPSFADDLGPTPWTWWKWWGAGRGFALEIPDGDAEKIRTLQDAVDYIQRHAKSVQE